MKGIKIVFTILVLCLAAQVSKAEWTKQNTNSFAWYKDIFFLDQNKGWLVGTDGIINSTADGGTTWMQTKKFTTDTILQVYFKDELNGWLLCERNMYARGNNATSYLRRTTDGGLTWEKIEFEDGGRERVVKLFFNMDGIGTAFGEGGVFYKLQDDGKTWKRSKTAIHYLLFDAAYADEKVGAIVGTGGTILFTEDSGYTWEKATLLGDTDTRFNAVFFAGTKGAWAVGTRGRIFYSNGGGRLWRQQDSTVTANLNDVYFTSANNGWAVGDNGIIVRTRDGGKNWDDVPAKVNHKLERITFVGTRGWAIGFGGTVLTYIDAASDPGAKPMLMKRS